MQEPMATATVMAMMLSDRDRRLPWMMRASTSRPNWSVPNQWLAEGPCSRSAMFWPMTAVS